MKTISGRFNNHGGNLYSVGISAWRAYLALQGMILTKIYRKTLLECGGSTHFGRDVYIGYPNRVQMGNNCYVGSGASLTSELPLGSLIIEDYVQISDEVAIDFTGSIKIKKNVLISARTRIISHDHGYEPHSDPAAYPLTIEENVWIGFNAVVLPGVEHIGRGAIVGAGSIVTKPVPEMAIVAGNPAKVIKFRDCVKVEGI